MTLATVAQLLLAGWVAATILYAVDKQPEPNKSGVYYLRCALGVVQLALFLWLTISVGF